MILKAKAAREDLTEIKVKLEELKLKILKG